MADRGAHHVEVPPQVHRDDPVPLLFGHVVDHAVAQEPGRVLDDVQAAEGVHGLLNHAVHRRQIGDAFGVGDRLAAGRADLVDHRLGRARIRALAVDAAAQVIDHDLGPLARRDQRDVPPDAASAAGDQHHLAVQKSHAPTLSRSLKPSLAPA